MKQYIFNIVAVLFLIIGVICIFCTASITDRVSIKKRVKVDRMCKIVGFLVCTISLLAIYYLN